MHAMRVLQRWEGVGKEEKEEEGEEEEEEGVVKQEENKLAVEEVEEYERMNDQKRKIFLGK